MHVRAMTVDVSMGEGIGGRFEFSFDGLPIQVYQDSPAGLGAEINAN